MALVSVKIAPAHRFCRVFYRLDFLNFRAGVAFKVNRAAVYGIVAGHLAAIGDDLSVFNGYRAARTVWRLIVPYRTAVHGERTAANVNTAAVCAFDDVVRNTAAIHHKVTARLAVDCSATGENVLCRTFCTRDLPGFLAVAENKFLVFTDADRPDIRLY